MCGRFVTPDEAEIERFWHVGRHNWKSPFWSIRQARFNVPPQQDAPENYILAIRADPDGTLELTDFQWWLLPSWSKEATTIYSTFNARVENVATSASFKTPFWRQRCIIPAGGWYEWQVTPSGKRPWYFHSPNGAPLALAGIWDRWERGDHVIDVLRHRRRRSASDNQPHPQPGAIPHYAGAARRLARSGTDQCRTSARTADTTRRWHVDLASGIKSRRERPESRGRVS